MEVISIKNPWLRHITTEQIFNKFLGGQKLGGGRKGEQGVRKYLRKHHLREIKSSREE
jgi:hypothetical protein